MGIFNTNLVYAPSLKIEFRAVPYGVGHVLEYRISPNQNITYEAEINIFGLFKIKITKKYNTSWHQPYWIVNWPGSERYSKESGEPYLPIVIHNKKELKDYQTRFNTCGEFFNYKHETEAKEEAAWQKARNEYLDNCGTWK